MDSFEGKVAVITGAASGMGRAMAERFAADGARVVAADVEEPALGVTVAEMTEVGHDVVGIVTDVSNEDDMNALADRVHTEIGAVNILCLNAGVGGGLGPLESLTGADWRWALDVNVMGLAHGLSAFLGPMKSHGDGHIVITASVAGLTSFADMAPYNASKHAAVTIAESLYVELKQAESTIGVSCLCPGIVRTNINNSDRNRPERLRGPALDQPGEISPEKLERFAAVREVFDDAIDPTKVADLVADAIKEDRFYVWTDDVFTPAIHLRSSDITEGRNPSVRGRLLDIYLD